MRQRGRKFIPHRVYSYKHHCHHSSDEKNQEYAVPPIAPFHLKKCSTAQQNAPKINTPAQKTHLSCLARLSTMRIVSPLKPRVLATLYSFRCVPLSISRCCPRSPSTARPRSRYSSSWALADWEKDCSRRACDSRVRSKGEVPKERELPPPVDGAKGEGLGREDWA